MAKPISEEELQLKKRARRRLIGAVALVAAVAAVLPMVLDSEPKSGSQDINIQIPTPEPKGAVVAKVAPVAPVAPATPSAPPAKAAPEKDAPKATEKAEPKATAAEKPAAKAPDNPNDGVLFPAQRTGKDRAAEKALAKAAEKPFDKAPEKVAEKPKEIAKEKVVEKPADKAPAPKAAPGSFFIQVIALSEADKARQVQQQIAGTGIRAYTEEVASGAGKMTRVRAGPFATREEADRAQARLQGIGLDGKVAAY